MNTCKVFVPFGAMGTGIAQDAFDAGIDLGPDIIACDAGSTDSGPYYLGTGKGKYARESVKTDLRLMIVAGHNLGVPVAVGSCGTCGSDMGVDEVAAMCEEICAEEGISLKLAKIYTEQDGRVLKQKYKDGKIKPLPAAPVIDEEVFTECSHIVALAGAEPFMKALEAGADVILCGRATDTAIIAAMPILKGCDVASAWHGAKIAECGAVCARNPKGGIFLTFDEEGVTVEPTAPGNQCTVYSTSAHMLYENSNPFQLTEPGVLVDVSKAVYTQINEKQVRISKAVADKKPYTMKLEGASPSGYQTITLVGIADKRVMKKPNQWIADLETYVEARLKKIGLTEGYSYQIKPYGFNAVTGQSIKDGEKTPLELGLVLVVTAQTQELATKVAKVFNPVLLHFQVEQNEQMPSFAFPFSPAEIQKGKIYEFRLNHVVEVDDALELVRMEYRNIETGR